ncbi:putative polyketide synthase [Daldinia vernicosa]|uniref:putative polyketide synthase n=1 Tax=Daldinia vernicosa TaxID=114800 RepID=UPI002007A5C0|nr:putative polyketide synthase [Daldinia vernicosa]KAI0853704.1 putative polyketide synthase [Daldinia vernicosa]
MTDPVVMATTVSLPLGCSYILIEFVLTGCRWPGGVHSPSQLWDLLKEKQDGWKEFSSDRINLNGFYHPNGQRPGSMSTMGGHLLQEDPRLFDHSFFGITATEAMSMDPSQRKLLEVTYEAFDSAGVPLEKLSGSRTGVFVGNFNNDYLLMQLRDPNFTLPYAVTGGGPAILSNRINYVFNLQGPSLVVDTACSASMYALHLAVLSLRNGDCDAAIVAGGNLILGPDHQILTSKLGAASPTSRCHTFDAKADGYSRAEGFGAIYLKRLSSALDEGNPIRAVVRGTSFNANGKTGGISHPSPEGQEAVIRQAYKNAGDLDPNLTGYFECHGTGTPVGDPIEVAALGNVFASGREDEPLLIGSVKPNLGHSEAASAMAQIMKGVLSLEHNEIPATIGIEKFNPEIDFRKARVRVVTDMTPWPRNKLRRVSINSFGYGGANAHCILDHPSLVVPGFRLHGLPLLQLKATTNNHRKDETYVNNSSTNNSTSSVGWPQPAELIQTERAGSRPFVLLPFSAHDDQALEANVVAISKCAEKFDLADLLYTLGSGKSRFSRRAFTVTDPGGLKGGLEFGSMSFGRSSGSPVERIGLVFTGQGAQWPGMGATLIHEYAVFRQTIRYLDDVLGHLQRKPTWTIEEVLLEPATTSRIHEPEFSQTICTALQIALVALLEQWGIRPVVTVGHSSGEIAAAYAAGRLRASEAIVLAYSRGQVVANNEQKGLMIAVGLGPTQIATYLYGIETEVTIAAVNSPENTTVSGDPAAIKELAKRLSAGSIFNRILKTGDNAYHSYHMLGLGESYEELANQCLRDIEPITLAEPSIPHIRWISSVTPDDKVLSVSPKYWRQNLESPVLFSQAVEILVRDNLVDLLIEIGPHPALSMLVKQIYLGYGKSTSTAPACLPSLRRGEHDISSMLHLVGSLFLHNAPIDIVAVNATEKVLQGRLHLQHGYPCVDMPRYNFTYPKTPLYFENRYSKEFRLRKHPRHDLLGARQPGCSGAHPSWRNVIRKKDIPWLDDHKLTPHTVLPAAAYISMAIEAASQIHFEEEDALPIRFFRLRNIMISSALRVSDNELGVEVVLDMEKEALDNSNTKSMWHKFRISSIAPDSDTWSNHCSGTIMVETRDAMIDCDQRLQVDARSRSLDMKRWYEKFTEVGLLYGPAFQGLSGLKAFPGTNAAAADVALSPVSSAVDGGESWYAIHPATLDTCIQLALMSCHAGQVECMQKAFVPIMADNIDIWIPETHEEQGCGVASGQLVGLRSLYAQVQLYSKSGHPLLNIGELKCVMYDGSSDTMISNIPREPYWRPVSRVDIDTLVNDSAKLMFPPKKIPPEEFESLNQFCSCVSDGLEARSKLEIKTTGIHNHDSPAARTQTLIEKLALKLYHIPEVRCIKMLYDNWDEIAQGHASYIGILRQGNLLQELYAAGITTLGSYIQLQRLVDLLAHKNPRMRILEISTGTGGAAASVLQTLKSNTPFKRYQDYVVTGPDLSYLEYVQASLKGHNGVSCQLLDIRKDPTTQGLEPRSFDLIIASGGLDQVPDAAEALKHVHALLKSKGKLALIGVTHPQQIVSILTHSLGWNRNQARISYGEDEWDRLLRECGFSGVDISLDDYVKDQTISTLMLTTASTHAKPLPVEGKQKQDLFLVYREYPPPLARSIDKSLSKDGFRAVYTDLFSHHKIPVGSLIISLIDIESITLLHRDETYFQAIQAIIAKNPTVLWVSAGDYAESSVMKGMWRCVANENVLLNMAMIEVDKNHLGSLSRTADLISYKFNELHASPNRNIDLECVLQNGALYIERFLSDEALNEQFRLCRGPAEDFEERPLEAQSALRANYKQPGLLSSLYFSLDPAFFMPLRDDWVEIKTQAIGLNMKVSSDLAVATAKFDWDYLSTEAAGIVSQVGSAVTSLRAGDRVFGFIPGNMGNYMRSPVTSVSKIPEGESSFACAASMSVAYLTAIYALKHLARLSEGESVLIQSAAGGLGMAATRIAKSLGAKIYATVGSNAKRKKLIEEFDIPACRIFHSRDMSTVDEIIRASGRDGIDVILNNAGGDYMYEIWKCIAPLGRFIDVGRTDVLGKGKLSLEVFTRNATFSSFDMGLIYRQRPELVESLMQELTKLWADGIIGPIDHITTLDISELESAMSFFSRGLHTGKMVMTFQNPKAKLKIARPANRASFDTNAAYILVGCLGGLGQSLANWMVERGAQHLIFLSRSGAERPGSTTFIEGLVRSGVQTEIIRCSVTDRDALTSVIERVSSKTLVKGVVHAAMVEGDAFFDKTNYSQIHQVLAPKVTGTINLHHATLHLPLDFFLMTSSFTASVGIASQSAYSAANAFQDAFSRFRISQNLPAISLAIGTVLEIGVVGDNDGFKQMLQRNGSYGLSETEFLHLLEGALCQSSLSPIHESELYKLDPYSSAQILLSFEPSRLVPYVAGNRLNDLLWYSNPRFQAIRQSIFDRTQEHTSKGIGTPGDVSSLSEKLQAVNSTEEKASIVREVIAERLAKLLNVAPDELDIGKPMSQYGLDSLVAAELRSWLIKTFGVDVTLLDLLSKGKSIADLVSAATEKSTE